MHLGIVGLGLIGGSLAMAAHEAGHRVTGFDNNPDAISQAQKHGAIDSSESIETMANSCDLVVLCVPSRTATQLVTQALQGTALVTDVSSVKKPICDVVANLPTEQADRFIGGHPMAGSEQSGFDAARSNMFENKMWIVVPPQNNSLVHVTTIESFVTSLGAEHCVLSPEQHDQLVAVISHLPQLASSTLMDIANDRAIDNEVILRLAGGGFRDMTRIAANNISMWLDIVHDNAEQISEALGIYIDSLTELKDSVDSHNADFITDLFSRARSARRSLPDAARRLENLQEILIPVPDKPGVLTTITALGSDINIYDIRIVHALEEDRGVLSLVVDPDAAQSFVTRLTDAGFEPRVTEISRPEE